MITRSLALFCLLMTVFLITGFVEAQQPKKVPRIGFLLPSDEPNTPRFQIEAFRQELRDLGYIEGKNILIEYRYAEGKPDRRVSLVAELVQLRVDLLVLVSVDSILAAKATKTIPVVMVATVDLVALGLVDSLAHPGG